MRGQELDERASRRLLKRPGVRVLHVYGPEPQQIEGADLDEVLVRLDRLTAGLAQPHSDFRIADFRDDNHNVMAVVEESC